MHDYLRLLFARLGTVHCGKCGRPVSADSPRTIARESAAWAEDALVLVLAPVQVSGAMSWDEQAGHLLKAGWLHARLAGREVTRSIRAEAEEGHEDGARRDGPLPLARGRVLAARRGVASRRSGAERAVSN